MLLLISDLNKEENTEETGCLVKEWRRCRVKIQVQHVRECIYLPVDKHLRNCWDRKFYMTLFWRSFLSKWKSDEDYFIDKLKCPNKKTWVAKPLKVAFLI